MLEDIGHTVGISNGEAWNGTGPGRSVRGNSFTWMSDENGGFLQKDPGTEFADQKTGKHGPNGVDRVDSQLVSASEYLRNAEREVVGLALNWDGESSTPETHIPDDVHPHDLTENGLREEMGLPDREHYLG